MQINNVDVGLDPKEYYVIHFDTKVRYLADNIEDAEWAFKSYSENQDLPFRITPLSEFGDWCRVYGEEHEENRY